MMVDKNIKKCFGQHFLRDARIVEAIVNKISTDKTNSVFEIGGGDGFLTKRILQKKCARLWVFEIDSHWVQELQKLDDARLTIINQDFLIVDFSLFEPHAPWILFGNLPYQITFPILFLLQKHRHLLKEGVIMVQEEVAQKILKKSGRGYGFSSLFFQWFFDWELMEKVPPASFMPPPKVDSRLLYFRPKACVPSIEREDEFWKFIKFCFSQPRRTLKNNLAQTHYDISRIEAKVLGLRAQQMTMNDFLKIWNGLQSSICSKY